MSLNHLILSALLCTFAACSSTDKVPSTQFQLLRKDATGLDFENVLRQSSEFNVFNYMYFFNGGGVAAGDFNNDGLIDLYFTSNMGPNKLFLNQGNLHFTDVTQQAGVAGMDGWTAGVTVVDINNDGLLDLYVSQMGKFQNITGQNQLYICKGIENGVPLYEDEAIPYGLDLVGFGTQAAFFDYDLDGDLDLFQMNHSLHANGTFGQKKTFQGTKDTLSGDRLLRNDGGHFTEVTMQAGINSSVIGYGLGIAVADVNLDGWPDVYIGNDFHENDYLYINQQNGTFKELLTQQMQHTSRFSMGVDIADINNDGYSEIISLDMMPEDPFILKSSLGEDGFALFNFKLGYGYNHQFAHNNLQLNNGNGTFSEIGMYAGIYATDWSWAPLFLDFDNDGFKDLFISNGIPRRMNDIDYVNFRANSELRWKQNTNNLEDADLVLVEKMPQIKLPNKFYRNAGDLRFQDIGKMVGNNLESYSNGAIYADLDNDGDLDIVVSNLEDEPFLYKNLLVENGRNNRHSLILDLEGPPANLDAIGTRVVVFKKEVKIVAENFPVRGYQSAAIGPLHIGVGDTASIDSILLIWPDLTCQRLAGLRYNQTTKVTWQKDLPAFDFSLLHRPPPNPYGFTDVTAASGIDFKHPENPFVEFDRERLIPHMVSSEGPALAVGDLNGDGLDDLFFGSGKRRFSAVFYQKPGGRFVENTPASIRNDSLFEDVDAVMVDIDNDGDLDLVVAAGGNEFKGRDEAMKQRYYRNDGYGKLQRVDFEGVFMTASCVLPADFNKDGLVDFFFGARALPWNYGITPTSALLLNKGNGQFENVAEKAATGLHDAGLVKNGAWADLDANGFPDLLLAIEWEPLTVFLNTAGKLEKRTLNDLKGWWNFVLPHDFDGDGDLDILAGNLGENSKLKPTPKHPVRMFVNDFDNNEQVEQILTYHLGGREIPFATYEEITKQMPPIKKKYLLSKNFAKASLEELFTKKKLEEAVVREANTFQSMYFENTGNGLEFIGHVLPPALQISTLNAAALCDLDGDGRQEVLLGGNFYECNIEMGRYDANYGNVLQFGKDGGMHVFRLGGLSITGQVRRIEAVRVGDSTYFVLAKNNEKVQVIRPGSGQEL